MPFSTVGDNATEIESIQGISDKGDHILLYINTNKKVKLLPQNSWFSRMRFSDEKGSIALSIDTSSTCCQCLHVYKVKGKIHPETGHTDPEKELRYGSTPSLTSALDGGGWQRHEPGCFTSGKETWYPFCRRLGGAQGQSVHMYVYCKNLKLAITNIIRGPLGRTSIM